MERDLLSSALLPKCPQQPELGHAEAWSQKLHPGWARPNQESGIQSGFPLGWEGTSCWNRHLLLPSVHTGRKLGLEVELDSGSVMCGWAS